MAWNYLSKVRPFSRVDDALGVVYTHGIAGFTGGMLLGIFGDPKMLEYGCGHLDAAGQVVNTSQSAYVAAHGACVPFSVAGLMYTGSGHQLWEQLRAALFVIFWSALVTYHPHETHRAFPCEGPRYSDEILEVGHLAIHDEEAFPEGISAEGHAGHGGGPHPCRPRRGLATGPRARSERPIRTSAGVIENIKDSGVSVRVETRNLALSGSRGGNRRGSLTVTREPKREGPGGDGRADRRDSP